MEPLLILAALAFFFFVSIALTRWIFRIDDIVNLLRHLREDQSQNAQDAAQATRYLLDVGKYAQETRDHLAEIKILLDAIERKSEETKK